MISIFASTPAKNNPVKDGIFTEKTQLSLHMQMKAAL